MKGALIGVGSLLAVFLLVVVLTPLTIGLGWYTGEANLRSFDHVRDTYSYAFDHAKAMDANARQACRYYQPNLALNQQSDVFNAVADNYARTEGEYDAYMEDHFRGNVIHPSQLPMPYPDLATRMKKLC